MPAEYSLNTATLLSAAVDAKHVHDDGALNIYAISKHSGIDRGVLSRVFRDENGPDLGTVVELADAYGLQIEDLIMRRRTPRPKKRRRITAAIVTQGAAA